ncbi:MAG TPA: hypothetical protein ENH01_07985 [Nitrospirae bacterium]|nr:hypothetical protein [Nitrospirota bacterium]
MPETSTDIEFVKVKLIHDEYRKKKHKPPLVEPPNDTDFDRELYYHGTYSYGMDLKNPKGEKYKHRFYVKNGKAIEGIIRKENFYSKEKLKSYVYLGGRDQNDKEIDEWHEDLSKLKKNDFIYYETFNDKVCHIGKNFLFKALFLHEEPKVDPLMLCFPLDIHCFITGLPLCLEIKVSV